MNPHRMQSFAILLGACIVSALAGALVVHITSERENARRLLLK